MRALWGNPVFREKKSAAAKIAASSENFRIKSYLTKYGTLHRGPLDVARRKSADGYWIGRHSVTKRQINIHRWLLEEHLGRALTEKENAHHTCGDKLCLDVNHLEVLTVEDHARHHNTGKFPDEPARQKMSDAQRRLWADPNHRANMVHQRRKLAASTSEKMRSLWSDPDYRASQERSRKAAKERRQSQ
jgi:hypothetical protein